MFPECGQNGTRLPQSWQADAVHEHPLSILVQLAIGISSPHQQPAAA
jgi:hypothetical protein